ncbi:hypothetical protein [Olivibacter sitiensis]|uniref:hypothetical protein n=1 Tax=Olivibacter sitiensis TaxID=376470 RepID=UPI00040EDDB0|nr:hypothetical protein [Olivibacter sitiensis]
MLDKTTLSNRSEVEEKDRSSSYSAKIYLFVLAIGALVATNIYFYTKYRTSSSNVVSMLGEKNQLEAELDRIELELDRVNVENQHLSDQLALEQQQAKKTIEDLRIKLTQNNLTQQQLNQAKTQIEHLRVAVDKFKNDSELLRQENMLLVVERDSLKEEVSHAHSNVEQLKNENSSLEAKIKSVAHLKISAITINPLSYTRKQEEKMESKAKRTEELKVVFTITDNPLANREQKDIYIRIIDPNGNLVLPKGNDNAITSPYNEMQYTSKMVLPFNNDGKEYIYRWDNNKDKFKKGIYTIVLYHDGESMGRANIALN